MQFVTDKTYYHPDKCTLNGHEIIKPVELRTTFYCSKLYALLVNYEFLLTASPERCDANY